MKQYELESKLHTLHLRATGIFGQGVPDKTEDVAGQPLADDESDVVLTYRCMAEMLVDDLSYLTDQPYYIEIATYRRDEDDPNNLAIIATVDDSGEMIVDQDDKSIESMALFGIQNFAAYSHTCMDDDFLGTVAITIAMDIPDDQEQAKDLDALIRIMIQQAFASFYATVDDCTSDEFRTNYIDAPMIAPRENEEDDDYGYDADETAEDEADEDGDETGDGDDGADDAAGNADGASE